jgi:hypothetical protein
MCSSPSSTRTARRERVTGIALNRIRAPLRQQRINVVLPHAKAIPSLRHSVLAYIPSTLLYQVVSSTLETA